MASNGSIQHIQGMPQDLKDLYKTAYEISQKAIINMAADRGAFICQSQSLNLFVENANYGKMSSMHFYSWEKGLKTGMYYLRSKAAVDPIKFTLDTEHQRIHAKAETLVPSIEQGVMDVKVEEVPEGWTCTMEDGCLMCGS